MRIIELCVSGLKDGSGQGIAAGGAVVVVAPASLFTSIILGDVAVLANTARSCAY